MENQTGNKIENKTANRKSRIFAWAMIIALAMFIAASLWGMGFISFGGKTGDVPPGKIYKPEDFKREISALYDKHAQELRELEATFLRDMADAGSASFQEARNNVDSTVEHFTGFNNTA